jgi:hypothetical protein
MRNLQWCLVLLLGVLASPARAEELFEAPCPCVDRTVDQVIHSPLQYHSSAAAAIDQDCCPKCGKGYCGCPGSVPCGGNWWTRCIKPCLQESHWGYADLFCEKPFGQCVNAAMHTHVRNGLAARPVLYRYDFYDGVLDEPHKLNAHGQRRVQLLLPLLENGCYPLIVQCTPEDPDLAAKRQAAVQQYLAQLSDTIPKEWVVVAEPRYPGLRGVEVITINQRLQNQTQQGGGVSYQGAGVQALTGAAFTGGRSSE